MNRQRLAGWRFPVLPVISNRDPEHSPECSDFLYLYGHHWCWRAVPVTVVSITLLACVRARVPRMSSALQLGTHRQKHTRFVRTICWMSDTTIPPGLQSTAHECVRQCIEVAPDFEELYLLKRYLDTQQIHFQHPTVITNAFNIQCQYRIEVLNLAADSSATEKGLHDGDCGASGAGGASRARTRPHAGWHC